MKTPDLSIVVKFATDEELEAARVWLVEQYGLVALSREVNEFGREQTVSARTDNWTSEIAVIYQLLIAAQAFKAQTELKQLTMF